MWILKNDSQNFNNTINNFLNERAESVRWLRSIDLSLLKNAYQHPKVGPVSGELLLTNWLAHDYLHFRQITKLKYDYLKSTAGQPLDYAGEW